MVVSTSSNDNFLLSHDFEMFSAIRGTGDDLVESVVHDVTFYYKQHRETLEKS